MGYKTGMSVAIDVGSADMGQQKVSYWAEVKSVLWIEGSTDGEAVDFTDRIAEDECYVWLLRSTRSSNHASENIFQKRYRHSGSLLQIFKKKNKISFTAFCNCWRRPSSYCCIWNSTNRCRIYHSQLTAPKQSAHTILRLDRTFGCGHFSCGHFGCGRFGGN